MSGTMKMCTLSTDKIRRIWKRYQMQVHTQQLRQVVKESTVKQWEYDEFGVPILIADPATGKDRPVTALAPHQVGDILWTYESFCKDAGRYLYKADFEEYDDWFMINGRPSRIQWQRGNSMPKEAIRTVLKVLDIRVQRLQDITGEDIWLEGFDVEAPPALAVKEGRNPFLEGLYTGLSPKQIYMTRIELQSKLEKEFARSWNQAVDARPNPKRFETDSWNANPWVWVYDFELIDWPQTVNLPSSAKGSDGKIAAIE